MINLNVWATELNQYWLQDILWKCFCPEYPLAHCPDHTACQTDICAFWDLLLIMLYLSHLIFFIKWFLLTENGLKGRSVYFSMFEGYGWVLVNETLTAAVGILAPAPDLLLKSRVTPCYTLHETNKWHDTFFHNNESLSTNVISSVNIRVLCNLSKDAKAGILFTVSI